MLTCFIACYCSCSYTMSSHKELSLVLHWKNSRKTCLRLTLLFDISVVGGLVILSAKFNQHIFPNHIQLRKTIKSTTAIVITFTVLFIFCVLEMPSAYPGSEFVVANTLAKWKCWSQMKLTLAKVSARK